MTDKLKNILIGLFVMGAVGIGISMLLFLKPQIGDGKKVLRVRFTNISGIAVGTRVTFAGKPVGEVLHIREIADAREHPDENGKVYFYELILKTDSTVEVYANDEVALRSTGLMGERSIAILPRSANHAQKITHEVIFANSTDPLENSFQQVAKVASKLDGMISHVDLWFQENSGPLTVAVSRLDQALAQAEALLKAVYKGEGSVGRLIGQDDFYLHLNSVLSKAETMMNDINHYGILFQYNKHWQRSRTKKANLLNAMQTPEEFRNYFEGEVDSITTSLGRISELMEKAEMCEVDSGLMNSCVFKEQLASLLRNVQSLADSIKLFNESLQPNDRF